MTDTARGKKIAVAFCVSYALEESFRAALVSMDEEASKFGLRVSWTKTKIENLGSGPTPSPIIVDGNAVDPVEEFTYLGSIYSRVRATPDRNISGALDSRPVH